MPFITDSGIEVPSVTEDQMREADRIAIEETGPSIFQMMENAGRDLALLAIELLGTGWEKANVIVLAGKGGNGGGGICAARHLANRDLNVKLCLSDPTNLRDVPNYQRKIFYFAGGAEIDQDRLSNERFDLIIDALIGYSLRSSPHGTVLELIEWANGTNASGLALDIPSGVDPTTGETYGEHIKANWTMTLALPKTGLNRENSGELYLADIGIPKGNYLRLGFDKYISPFGNNFCVKLNYV
jgi:NAD(P)H-hydrate epimerase